MEPFDYPDNDPGPQTLLTSLDAGQNLDRLQWFMSRLQGYVGIANYMGARFTASEQALSPVLRETAKRGLIYFDDGSSAAQPRRPDRRRQQPRRSPRPISCSMPCPRRPRSTARWHAGGAGARARRRRGLRRRAAGFDRAHRDAGPRRAESRGILLVPISATVARAKSS